MAVLIQYALLLIVHRSPDRKCPQIEGRVGSHEGSTRRSDNQRSDAKAVRRRGKRYQAMCKYLRHLLEVGICLARHIPAPNRGFQKSSLGLYGRAEFSNSLKYPQTDGKISSSH
jgi:hypothetical protein